MQWLTEFKEAPKEVYDSLIKALEQLFYGYERSTTIRQEDGTSKSSGTYVSEPVKQKIKENFLLKLINDLGRLRRMDMMTYDSAFPESRVSSLKEFIIKQRDLFYEKHKNESKYQQGTIFHVKGQKAFDQALFTKEEKPKEKCDRFFDILLTKIDEFFDNIAKAKTVKEDQRLREESFSHYQKAITFSDDETELLFKNQSSKNNNHNHNHNHQEDVATTPRKISEEKSEPNNEISQVEKSEATNPNGSIFSFMVNAGRALWTSATKSKNNGHVFAKNEAEQHICEL